MCDACGCTTDLERMSGAEQVKARSNAPPRHHRRELLEDTPVFSDDAGVILKFHGVYQQDDRDLRKEARRLGLDKHHMMMIRTRIPGGIVTPGRVSRPRSHRRAVGKRDHCGSPRGRTCSCTGCSKGDLKRAIRAINDGLLTTLGGCGDQERNIMCCPAPWHDQSAPPDQPDAGRRSSPGSLRRHARIARSGSTASSRLRTSPIRTTRSTASATCRASSRRRSPSRATTVSTSTRTISAWSRTRTTPATLVGFDMLVGGGLGRTANKPNTWPAVARRSGSCAASTWSKRLERWSRSSATTAIEATAVMPGSST